jgi:hypothetical protein
MQIHVVELLTMLQTKDSLYSGLHDVVCDRRKLQRNDVRSKGDTPELINKNDCNSNHYM